MTQPALDLVIAALERIREKSDRAPCASRTALARLQNASAALAHRPALRTAHAISADAVESAVPSGDSDARNKADLLAAVRERVARLHEMCASRLLADANRVRRRKSGRRFDVHREAPGADEDQQGEPFVGRAGQLLTRILKAMNFAREDVYIANILKCRPDMPAGSFGNRPPTPTEMQTCRPYLVEQIDIIQPSVLVALGAVAVEGLLGTRTTMRELRGRWHTYNSIPLMITYHPAYLLRNQAPSEKRKVWEDMLQVLERLERPISERQRNYFL